jgi:hypothetical protein
MSCLTISRGLRPRSWRLSENALNEAGAGAVCEGWAASVVVSENPFSFLPLTEKTANSVSHTRTMKPDDSAVIVRTPEHGRQQELGSTLDDRHCGTRSAEAMNPVVPIPRLLHG